MSHYKLTHLRPTTKPVRISSWQQNLAQAQTGSRVRVWPFLIQLAVVAVVLVSRLFQLTVVEGAYYRARAETNRMVSVRSAAERGLFFDRHDEPLVRNTPAYKRQKPGTTLSQAVFEQISREEALQFAQQQSERVYYDISREYLCGAACANFIGYMGEIDKTELASLGGDYILGDLLGKTGLEKVYETELRGRPGNEMVEVDAQGEAVRSMGEKPSNPGVGLHLTIDTQLQELAYEIMATQSGALVAQRPQTGEVLALVSTPTYDPNNVAASLQATNQPFFNRALQGTYPPGSIYKIITSVAGLESDKVTADTAFEDSGEIAVNGYTFGNWFYLEHGRTDGSVNIIKALQRSNDIYFYRVGQTVGVNVLAEWSQAFGLGEAISLSGLETAPGVVPNPQWKERTKGEKWYLGNTFHMSIGQGDVLVTPLQLNRAFGAIAAQGVLCQPSLLQREVGGQSCRQLNLEESTLSSVQEGLVQACKPGGTGVPFFQSDYPVACKTGTAQQGSGQGSPHAWFSVYAPAPNPDIVITVLVEQGGQGSEVAAPVAKKVLDWWMTQSEEYRN